MDDLSSQFPAGPQDNRDNLTRLLNRGRRKRVRIDRRYSVFVRGMQILLPMIALGLVAVVLAWPKMDDTSAIIRKEEIIPQKTGQNELVRPRYESADNNNNPYVITAERAVQDMADSAVILLERPQATMTFGNTDTLTGQAKSGVYRQNASLLRLTGEIVIAHSNGYALGTDIIDIDTRTSNATTDQPVTVTGPDATLTAAGGMNANSLSGTVIFLGPAKLTLNRPMRGLP